MQITESRIYKNRLDNAHRSINRVMGDLMRIQIDDSNKELMIAIQYLKDAGRSLTGVENILHILNMY